MSLAMETLAAMAAGIFAGERIPLDAAAILALGLGLLLVAVTLARGRLFVPRFRRRALRGLTVAAVVALGGTRAATTLPSMRAETGTSSSASLPRATPFRRPPDPFASLPLIPALRAAFDHAASPHLSGNALALYRGMVLGRREHFEPELLEAMKRAGTTHLLAVSGLNVAVLVVALDMLLRMLRCPARAAAWMVIPAVFVYAVLVGGDPPVMRAAVMGSFVVGGRALGRGTRAADSLAASACFLLAWRPAFLHDAGFQLSYAAVGALIAAGPLLKADPARGRVRNTLRAAMGTTLAAQAGVFPLILALDGRLSLIAPVANLAAVPPSGLIVPVGLVLPLAAGPLSPLAPVIAGCAWALARVVEVVSLKAASLPGAAVTLGAPPPAVTALYYGGWALALLRRRRPEAGLLVVVASAVLMCAPVFGPGGWLARTRASTHFIFLDVGQGDACVIRSSRGSTVLLDAGPAGARFDAGFARVAPWLRRDRVRRIDLAILTHAHDDHVGGFPAVLAAFPVTTVADGGEPAASMRYLRMLAEVAARGARYRVPAAGDTLLDDGVMRIIAIQSPAPNGRPPAAAPWDLNEGSVGVAIESGGSEVILLGDLPARKQEALLDHPGRPRDTFRIEALPCVLFAAPHHGSRTGLSPRFLAALRPAWVLISAGRANRFGFPHPETLHALAAAKIPLRITGRDGDVSLEIRPGYAELRGARDPRSERARIPVAKPDGAGRNGPAARPSGDARDRPVFVDGAPAGW